MSNVTSWSSVRGADLERAVAALLVSSHTLSLQRSYLQKKVLLRKAAC